MQVTRESRRRWWLAMLGTWVVCGALILVHTRVVREYVALLDAQGLHDAEAASTPLRQVIPARFADAQMWVRNALAAREAGDARMRFTRADNAPAGREVHWSSAFGWLVRGAGSLQRAITGQPLPLAQERALLWFNAPLLLAVIMFFSTWIGRRAGAGAGVFVALAMVGHARFYEAFAPVYVDHHGLVDAAVLGLVAGAALMGAGWWKPAAGGASSALPASIGAARRAAIFSAVCGALGMWMSAAVVLPVIALAGLAGVVILWWQGRDAISRGVNFEPRVWRMWGRTGALTSFACYLIEYAPAHIGLRLEVNHPLYSLAWWGGAEIVAILGAARLGSGRRPPVVAPRATTRQEQTGAPKPWRRRPGAVDPRKSSDTRPKVAFHFKPAPLLLPLLALAAAPFTILVGGSSVFLVSDPFVGAMRHFVAEGRSFVAVARQYGMGPLWYDVISALILVPAVVILIRRRDDGRLVLGFVTVIAGALIAMAFFDMRWWLTGSGPQIALLLVLLTTIPGGSLRARWTTLVALGAVLFVVPAVARVVRHHRENRAGAATAVDLLQPLYRDIAATLRASQPEGDIVLLATPNPSLSIAYYGRFKSLGTLFWENAPGLRAAAQVLCAQTDDEAAALIKARGVTHIVEISAAPFLREYFQLLHPHGAAADSEKTFGYRLATTWRGLPRWLQPIAYRPPADLKHVSDVVRLFKVAWDQPAHEHLFHTAIAQAAGGDPAGAEQTFDGALAAAPAADRQALCASAGAAFYDLGADAAAVRIFRRALGFGDDSDIANTVAWILATSSDATVRDGPAALALVKPLLDRARDDPSALSTFAAASAEVGRFPDAVRAAEQALAAVRRAGDREAEALLQRRLESYRAGRPWRQ